MELLPPEIGLLNNTGFDAPLSVRSMNSKYRHNLTLGMNPDQAIIMPIKEVVGDILGYRDEYVSQESWLCSPLLRKQYHGQDRLFNWSSNQPISEGITREERFGAVADVMASAEPFLLNAPNNSRIVVYNPSGWSGMKDRKGNLINYRDAQISFLEKDAEGNYQSNTLVMDDFVSDQAARFYISMGQPHPAWDSPFISEQERVSQAVKNAIFLPNTDETFESIVQKIQAVKGTNIVRHLANGQVRTFEEVYQKMKFGNALLRTDTLTQSQIDKFIQFAENNKDTLDLEFTQKRVQQELETTLLNISRIIRGEQPINLSNYRSLREAYKRDIGYLELIGGCNGGGSDAVQIILQTATGVRVGEVSSNESKSTLWCTRCQEKNICNTDFCYKPECRGRLTPSKPIQSLAIAA